MAATKEYPNYRILWIENRRVKVPAFVPALQKRGYEVCVVHSGKAARKHLTAFTPDLIVLYAASFGTSGCRMAKSLRALAASLPILLIGSPEAPPKPNAPVSATLVLPFTTRKLFNSLRRLLPEGRSHWKQVGLVALDERRRVVRCHGRETRLTPRLMRLLQYFMAHPGEVLPYQQIFRSVWETDYLGDTRTLQVHVAWLRKALEEDPQHPRLLETLRGIGYRFHPEGRVASSSPA